MQFAVAGHQMRSLDVHKGVAERSPSGRVMSQVEKPCYRWVDGCLWLWNHMESHGIIWNHTESVISLQWDGCNMLQWFRNFRFSTVGHSFLMSGHGTCPCDPKSLGTSWRGSSKDPDPVRWDIGSSTYWGTHGHPVKTSWRSGSILVT